MAKVRMNLKKRWEVFKNSWERWHGGESKVSQRKSLFALESTSLSQDIYTHKAVNNQQKTIMNVLNLPGFPWSTVKLWVKLII